MYFVFLRLYNLVLLYSRTVPYLNYVNVIFLVILVFFISLISPLLSGKKCEQVKYSVIAYSKPNFRNKCLIWHYSTQSSFDKCRCCPYINLDETPRTTAVRTLVVLVFSRRTIARHISAINQRFDSLKAVPLVVPLPFLSSPIG